MCLGHGLVILSVTDLVVIGLVVGLDGLVVIGLVVVLAVLLCWRRLDFRWVLILGLPPGFVAGLDLIEDVGRTSGSWLAYGRQQDLLPSSLP